MIIEEVKKELTGHIIPFWNKLTQMMRTVDFTAL